MIINNKSCDIFIDDAISQQTAGKRYDSIILFREEMEELVMQKANINGGDFVDCGFKGSVFDESQFSEVIFKLCDLEQAAFSACKFKHVRFIDCKLDNADFSAANLENCEFIRCDGSIITEEADLATVSFLECDIQDSNLSATALFNVAFRKSNLNDTSFDGSYAMEVSFEQTSILGADLNWEAVHVLKTDGYFNDYLKLLKGTTAKVKRRAVPAICHNAVLITG